MVARLGRGKDAGRAEGEPLKKAQALAVRMARTLQNIDGNTSGVGRVASVVAAAACASILRTC